MLTGILTLAGVCLGYWLTDQRSQRRDAALIDALTPRPMSVNPPTITQIDAGALAHAMNNVRPLAGRMDGAR